MTRMMRAKENSTFLRAAAAAAAVGVVVVVVGGGGGHDGSGHRFGALVVRIRRLSLIA